MARPRSITPVGSVKSARANWTQGDGEPGEVTMKLREALLDLQTGQAPDPHGWMHQLEPSQRLVEFRPRAVGAGLGAVPRAP